MGFARVRKWMAAGVMGLSLVGCTYTDKQSAAQPSSPPPDQQNVTAPPAPMTVVVQAPPPAIVVPEAPPAIIVEQRPAAPGEGYFFVDGFWHWGGARFEWVSGRWMRPPEPKAVWTAPRYEHTAEGHRYTPGHWRK